MSLKEKYTLEYLRENNLILLEVIAGSKAYGTNTEKSDHDIRGVFYLEKDDYLSSFESLEEVSDAKQDIKYFELKKFLLLLSNNNPNILELLNMPEDCINYKSPIFDNIKPELFLSKLCKDSFGNYAMSQIKKARGLNKKITFVMSDKKKSIFEFCYVISGIGSIPFTDWLLNNNYDQKYCGLSKIDHLRDMHVLYYDKESQNKKEHSKVLRGLLKEEEHTNLLLSSVPKENIDMKQGFLYYNEDGYKRYLKEYSEYMEWKNNRNEERYNENVAHGKNYDGKNLSHCIRLLSMSLEIAEENKIQVRRDERDYLLAIKRGEYDYDSLIKEAEKILKQTEEAYKKSSLPEKPVLREIEELHLSLRKEIYKI
jgi:hypothetical protein